MNNYKKFRIILNANLFTAIIVLYLEPLSLFQHIIRHLYLSFLICSIMYLFPYLMSLLKFLLFHKKQVFALKSEIENEQPVQLLIENKENITVIDIESWYSLIGKPLLVDLIIDLNARGFQELFINELGEIYIKKENLPEIKGTFPHFPCKEYWPTLINIFAEDELSAMQCEDTINLSWK